MWWLTFWQCFEIKWIAFHYCQWQGQGLSECLLATVVYTDGYQIGYEYSLSPSNWWADWEGEQTLGDLFEVCYQWKATEVVYKWLSLAEWWYDTTYHTTMKMTPFEALYRYAPTLIPMPQPEGSNVASAESHLREQSTVIQISKDNMSRAQVRMKQYEDQHRSEREF